MRTFRINDCFLPHLEDGKWVVDKETPEEETVNLVVGGTNKAILEALAETGILTTSDESLFNVVHIGVGDMIEIQDAEDDMPLIRLYVDDKEDV